MRKYELDYAEELNLHFQAGGAQGWTGDRGWRKRAACWMLWLRRMQNAKENGKRFCTQLKLSCRSLESFRW